MTLMEFKDRIATGYYDYLLDHKGLKLEDRQDIFFKFLRSFGLSTSACKEYWFHDFILIPEHIQKALDKIESDPSCLLPRLI